MNWVDARSSAAGAGGAAARGAATGGTALVAKAEGLGGGGGGAAGVGTATVPLNVGCATIASRNCAEGMAMVDCGGAAAAGLAGAEGRAGGAAAGVGANAAPAGSLRLGDGIFFRMARVSISRPVTNTSISSDAVSSLPTSAATAST